MKIAPYKKVIDSLIVSAREWIGVEGLFCWR